MIFVFYQCNLCYIKVHKFIIYNEKTLTSKNIYILHRLCNIYLFLLKLLRLQ